MIMRVRPRLGQISPDQAIGLCQIAMTIGNGTIDLTNRANLQLRGIAEGNHQAVLDALLELELLDETPELEARRNIICAPLHSARCLTTRLAQELTNRLGELPDLPAKFGFVIDADGPPQLGAAPADIRIESGARGLIVRADGAALGQPVEPETAINALISIANWFAQTCKPDIRRMAPHLLATTLPQQFASEPPLDAAPKLVPSVYPQGQVFGAPFGNLPAKELMALVMRNPAATLTLTPWRMFMLGGQDIAFDATSTTFITTPDNPALQVDACPGAPACAASHIKTRALARRLAPHLNGKSLHISGCTKGCARPRRADVVLVGQEGGFDLVLNGCSWDVPAQRGIKPDSVAAAVIKELGRN
jgi:precorrin-3B synthase